MRRGKIILPREWDRWDKNILDNFNSVFTIEEMHQSNDLQTYVAYGRSPLFKERDDCPLYILLLDEKHNITFKEFKEEEF